MSNEKDWSGTGNSIFKQLGASSHSSSDREQNDYYATDPKAIDDLMRCESFNNKIWECACGGGHLVKKLKEYGYQVYATDIIKRDSCCEDVVDFLHNDITSWEGDIITNPPYKFCTEFILKGLQLLRDGGKMALFLKLTTLEGQDRYNKIYADNPPYRVYVYSKRIQCAINGEFNCASSAVCYAWFVWKKGYKGDTVIKWITEKNAVEQVTLF